MLFMYSKRWRTKPTAVILFKKPANVTLAHNSFFNVAIRPLQLNAPVAQVIVH